MERGKVLIIGLDGATWKVLKPWLENNSLPNLEKLRRNGCWGNLYSTIPPLSAPAWSSMITGKNPGKHSVFHFVNQEREQTKPQIINSRSVKSSTLWDILGHHNRKVGIINVPMTYPPRPVNGFMITGLLTPPSAPIFTHPPELSQTLTDYQIDLERFIAQKPFARDSDNPPRVEPSLGLMEEFQTMMEKRGRTALALMKSEPWHLFMTVFTGTDRMGHYLWPYHRDVDSDGSAEWGRLHQAVYDYYVRLDQIIGEMLNEAGQETTTIIISDHGMGPNYTKSVHWNDWLRQQGLLSVKSTITSPEGWLFRLGLPRDKIARIARRIPGLADSRLVRKVKGTNKNILKTEETKTYYKHIYGNVGGFFINLKEPEKETLRKFLIEAVQEVIDPTTKQPITQSVYRGEDCYFGPYATNIPDVVLVMAPEYGSERTLSHYSSIVTEIQGVARDPGGHQMEGIFIANGPAIASISEPLPKLSLLDITPTILYLMGLPIPPDIDGRVITEIVQSQHLQDHPAIQGEPVGLWPDGTVLTESSEDEPEELVLERLRALGYID